jgi:methyl-accepting chemotaxis protein
MKFRHSAPAVLITAAVIVIAMISLASNMISHRMAAAFEDAQFEIMGKIMQSKLNGAEGKAIAAAETIAASPAVKKAFAAQDREGLLATTRDAYRVLHEKYGISQAQFHLAPAVSFLRVHNPERHGDDQSQFRQIVVEVNRVHAIRKGIEITTSGIGIFGTLPMQDGSGKPLGSFEAGMEFSPLLDELKKTYGFELAVYFDEKTLRETATSLKGDIFNEKNRVGPYVTFYATHPELIRSLVGDGDISITEDSNYQREAAGKPYGVLLQPVYNYAKKQIGVVAIAADFSATRAADGQATVWQTLLGVLSAIVLIGAILVVVRGKLLRPLQSLNDHVSALSNNTDAGERPDTAGWCEEMRDLAKSCEQLAAQDPSPRDRRDAA